ncbi:MAG: hypothetical protein LBE18_11195 [Planctomycetaceae bacterium]|jgi:cation transport ATPase|nr:hypothetical protein [Planctomycetaceae bacterium]
MSTDTNLPINTNNEKTDSTANVTSDTMREQLLSIEIPANIDPRLLELWLYRERQEIERRERKEQKRYTKQQGRSLGRIFAAFTGIVVMMLMILLGLIQNKEVNDILINACIAFLVYTIIGFLIGYFVEGCVADSVEVLLREIVKRTEPNEETNEITN